VRLKDGHDCDLSDMSVDRYGDIVGDGTPASWDLKNFLRYSQVGAATASPMPFFHLRIPLRF
jgi:hypothetical protein